MPRARRPGMDHEDRRGRVWERGAMQVQPTGGLGRIPILDVAPVVGGGRWPAKAVVGETIEVSA
ncbi:maltotransferase domain-containing protein, partial [Spirillospora sp. NPDC046719]